MKDQKVKSLLLGVYPEFETVYGPYVRKDGRKHVVLHNSSGRNKTISWPKAIVEATIGKQLEKDETVDHIDRDFTNDSPENLQVLKRSEHAKKDVFKRTIHAAECQYCSKLFTPTPDQIARRNEKRSGPYCSRSCAGKASHIKGKRARIDVSRTYFR